MKYFKYSLLIVTLVIPSLATAALITETWQSTIRTVSNTTAFNVGDVIQWTVTYDDTSTVMHFYLDGSDGVAGTGDDILDSTPVIDCPDGEYCGQYSLFSDAVFGGLENFTAPLLAEFASNGHTVRDAADVNISALFRYTSGEVSMALVRDELNFLIDMSTPVENGWQYLALAYTSSGGAKNWVVLSFESEIVDLHSSVISEPSSVTIFCLVFMGLVARKVRRG
ncbi:hypothetical protein SAMN05216361_4378 [Marisediminitalea aggregata]|uniref:PEP-CTERM protein-sorting domain-containing protein n=1 Tax=Marisediminitalea aggregata TaxID=634436 RepID=A0A1M5SDE2_9ALTE|nr:hypothetical protein [Marisediminitalea aggregata]SHH35943.1 hypothetical protein SAMN05216361_4378 [Marisediminitalea aggregata]